MPMSSPNCYAYPHVAIDGRPLSTYRFFKALTAMTLVEEIYLTSSRARGDHSTRSDIDLAIACPLATEEEWQAILRTARYNSEMLLRVDALRMDTVTDPGQRNFLLHKRQLLYLKTRGADGIIPQEKAQFFLDWNNKLEGWYQYLPKGEAALAPANRKALVDAFEALVNCIWIMQRKALATHGHYTNTPISTFHGAWLLGWLEDRHLWERMIEDYNTARASHSKPETSHALLSPIAARIPQYTNAIRASAQRLIAHIQPYIASHVTY